MVPGNQLLKRREEQELVEDEERKDMICLWSCRGMKDDRGGSDGEEEGPEQREIG